MFKSNQCAVYIKLSVLYLKLSAVYINYISIKLKKYKFPSRRKVNILSIKKVNYNFDLKKEKFLTKVLIVLSVFLLLLRIKCMRGDKVEGRIIKEEPGMSDFEAFNYFE